MTYHLRRLLFTLSLFLFSTAISFGQEKALASIRYELSMPRPVSHLFHVTIEVEMGEAANKNHLDFQMPRWSPGRYAVFDFAKNVQEFSAASGICPRDAQCKLGVLPSKRVDSQTWRVETAGARSLTVSYKVFGDDLSGTFSQLDARHANFNGASVFMYVVDHKQDPVTLSISPPQNWRITNGRVERADQREWNFANYDILIDTPTEVAPDWTVDEFKVDGKTYRVVVHSFGAEGGKRAALVRDIEKIVRAHTRMWGVPELDSYTFLIHFAADDRSGDGMEHLTSTQIILPGALSESSAYQDALATVSHEFFHVWNVKRLRPVELGPWDFTRPLATRSLWIAEGLTTYYGNLMLRRARLWNDAQFLDYLSGLIGGVENSPGNRLMSAEDSSLSAPFLDGEVHEQRTNLGNTSISYYPKGAVLGLTLDLLIRQKTGGRASLDDVLRRMYEEFYLKSEPDSYYLRGRGYTVEDFERAASRVAGTDLSDFFRRYARGVETPPYDEVLRGVGLRLARTPRRTPYTAGISLDSSDTLRVDDVRNDSPAEDAGLQQGDVLVKIGDQTVTRENWTRAISLYKQKERVPVRLRRDRRIINTFLKLTEPYNHDYRVEEIPDATPEMRAMRAAWMSG